MPCWMKHKLESGLPGEISIASDMQMTPPAGDQPRLIQGIRRRDGVDEGQGTTA